MKSQESIKQAADVIQQADALFITAGAGIGVDSGLPDFRGDEGFWKAYPPIAKLGISFVEMANPQWFFQNPKLAWAFYGHRLNLYRKTIPHKGFTRLLEIAENKKGGYFVFTSNVDGQFQKAGFDDNKIEECHGTIHHFQCSQPCNNDIWDASKIEVKVDEKVFEAQEPLPVCKNCNGTARPNILLFGDWLWNPERTQVQGNRLYTWLQAIHNKGLSLAVIEIGAGTAVATVRYKSEDIAQRYNATLIRINPRDSYVPSGNISIPSGASEGINSICELLCIGYRV